MLSGQQELDKNGLEEDSLARAGVGFVPEDRRIFAELSVRENLDVARRAAARPGRWTIEAIIDKKLVASNPPRHYIALLISIVADVRL